MTRLTLIIPALVALLVSGSAWAVNDILNSQFAKPLGQLVPYRYSEYKRLMDSELVCITENKQKLQVCVQVHQKLALVVMTALLYSEEINETVERKHYCDTYITDLRRELKTGALIGYSMLVLDNWIKYGSALYGDNLNKTYLAKIIFDALSADKPCKS